SRSHTRAKIRENHLEERIAHVGRRIANLKAISRCRRSGRIDIMRIIKTVWSSVGAMVVATAVAGGCGETADPRPDDGSGGSAGGGAKGSASGGADEKVSGGVVESARGGKKGEVIARFSVSVVVARP